MASERALYQSETARLQARLVEAETKLSEAVLSHEKEQGRLKSELANSCSSAVMIRQAELSEASLTIYRDRCAKLEKELGEAHEEIQQMKISKAISQGKALAMQGAQPASTAPDNPAPTPVPC